MDFNIEEWCSEFLSLDKVPMHKDLSMMMMSMALLEADPETLTKQVADNPLFQMTSARADAMHLSASVAALIFIGALAEGKPGTVVMYLSLFKQKIESTSKKVDIEFIAEVFPWGFPEEENLQVMWDKQKTSTGNALDAMEWYNMTN